MKFPCVHTIPGSGRQYGSNEGPPEARLMFAGAKPMRWVVTLVGIEATGRTVMWRAEVGPMLPGARSPRLFSEFGLRSII
jgi:hypothetical protein